MARTLLFKVIFLFYLLTSDGALSCESAERDLCDSLSEIVPSASHITINLNDIRYQLLADAVENCTLDHAEGQPKYRLDCTKLGNRHRYFMVQESPPSIFVLARQINVLQNGLDWNEEHTAIKESFRKTTAIEVLEVTIYEGNSVKTGGSETKPRWLKNLMVGVQVVSILLLLLTALLAGISRTEDPAYQNLYCILTLSAAGTQLCQLIGYFDNIPAVPLMLLSIAEHYLWLVICLACLTASIRCRKGLGHRPRQPLTLLIGDKELLYVCNEATESLAETYLVIFVLPLLYVAPLPFIENYLIQRKSTFHMIEILTRLYTNGQSSIATMLLFVLPMSLVGLINIVLTIRGFIHCQMGKREKFISILLLIANITLPISYVCMIMFKPHPVSTGWWGLATMLLSLSLSCIIGAGFIVDRVFAEHTFVWFDQKSRYWYNKDSQA